jgi:glycosyltransferase involved in cell wall biosynthesis
VRKILLVTDHLAPCGRARLLSLLAAGLPPGQVCVCVLGESSPWCDELRGAGVGVEVLGWRRALDLRPLLSLRSVLRRERPEVVHAFGFAAAWALVLSGARAPGRLVLSSALPPNRRLAVAERLLLRRCGRVVAIGEAEANAYRRLGVLDARLAVAPPAVPSDEPAARDPLPGIPEGKRVVVTVGPITMHKGQRDAVWALDILRCLYDDLLLVIVGAGPDEERVRRFTQIAQLTDRVYFTGPVADVRPWLMQAEVVWVNSFREGGRQTALEAMAAGRPVVASRLPGLAEVIDDGRTGFLITPGDKAELCRQTRILLDHAQLRQEMGEAGRQRVAERFAPARMVEAITKVYEGGSATR